MFGKKKKRGQVEVNASSMADIAFLLLIFFLVATTIENNTGMRMVLPEKKDDQKVEVEINDRNVFKVRINSYDKLSVEDEEMVITDLRTSAIEFLSNNGTNKNLSDSPQEAVISFKTDRGTSYKMYLQSLNELIAAYHQLRADYLNISMEEYKIIIADTEGNYTEVKKQAKAMYPMRLSIAEPTDFGS